MLKNKYCKKFYYIVRHSYFSICIYYNLYKIFLLLTQNSTICELNWRRWNYFLIEYLKNWKRYTRWLMWRNSNHDTYDMIFLENKKCSFINGTMNRSPWIFDAFFCDQCKRNLQRSLALLCAVLLWATPPIAFLRTTYFFLPFFFTMQGRASEWTKGRGAASSAVHIISEVFIVLQISRYAIRWASSLRHAFS